MKHSGKMTAGVLGAAVLMQNLGAMPLLPDIPAVTASAASVQSIQTRIYEYDFHTFKALYDIRTKRWFTEAGAQIVSVTKPEQQMTASDNSGLKLSLNFDKQTASVCSGSSEQDCTEQLRKLFFDPLAEITPAYEQQTYYDRAQQKEVPLPEPEFFPLTYICGEQFRNSAPAKLDCRIKFGEYDYGTVGISMTGTVFTTDPDTGMLLETAGDLTSEATVMPYTAAGDVNFNRTTDISDAVIASRIVAEDYTAKITDIGRTLADQNCDDRLDSGDISDIICDVAGIPYAQRVPADTIPVISMNKLSPAEAEQVFGKEALANDYCIKTCVVPGEQYDTWYAVKLAREDDTVYDDYRVQSVVLTPEGVVQLELFTLDSFAHSFFYGVKMQVPHNALPDDTQFFLSEKTVEKLPQYTPDVRFIPVLPVPKDTIPVLKLEQPAADPEAMAQTFGFESADAMRAAAEKESDSRLNLQACTPGTETDVWDLAVWQNGGFDEYGWDAAEITDIIISSDGLLRVSVQLMSCSEEEPAKMDFVWFRVTVPHGTLPEDLNTVWNTFTGSWYYDESPAVRYICKAQSVWEGVPGASTNSVPPKTESVFGYSNFFSGLENDSDLIPADVLAELDASESAFVSRIYTDPETTPDPEAKICTEDSDVVVIYCKTPADADGGYYNQMYAESGVIEGNTLNLKIAEYRPLAQKGLPVHYDRLIICTEKDVLTLAGVEQVAVKKDAFYDSIRHYTTKEKTDPASTQNEDGTWNVYEYDSQLDDCLAAADQYGSFTITGDVPEQYTEITQTVNISVINFMTGEPVPGFRLEILPESYFALPVRKNDVKREWTTDAENPFKSFEISAYKCNYGIGAYDTSSFCVKACGTLDGYESPDAKSFRLTGDSEPLNIVLYTYPDKETENVHFTLVDRAAGQNLMKNREVTPHTYLLITDTDGRAYYCISMQFQSDFLLPDGTYTVQMLTDFSAKYVAAEPDVPLDQWDAEGSSSSKTITVTVKDGVPDQPLYTFELIQRPQK